MSGSAGSPRGGSTGPLRAHRLKGLLLATAGVALVATNFVTAKYALAEYNSFTILPLWFVGPILAGTVYIMGYGSAWRVQVRRNLWSLLGIGVCNGLSVLLVFAGLDRLDPSVTAFLGRSGALYSIILAYIFLGERFGIRCLSGMALVLAGVVVITYRSGASELLGIVLVLTGFVFTSLNFFIGKKVTSATNPVVLIWMRAMASLGVVVIAAIVSGRFAWHFSAPHLIVLAAGSLIGPFAGQILSFYSLRYIGLSELEILRATQPLLVVVYSLVFLGMLPTLHQGIGGAVVVMGVLLLVASRSVERTDISATS